MNINETISLVTSGSAEGPFPRIVRWLADGLASKGRQVDIVFLQGAKGVQYRKARIREIGFGTRARYSVSPLLRYFTETNPSLVIATPCHVVPAVLIAGRLARVSVVPWEGGFVRYGRRFWPFASRYGVPVARRLLYGWSAAIAAVSEDLAKELRNEFKSKKIFRTPNPCDTKFVQEAAGLTEHRKGERCKLVAVGRLIHLKGIDVLLRALNILCKKGVHSWQMKLVGAGPMIKLYQNMAAMLGLEERVEFLGYVSNPYPIMSQSDIFIHAARCEGFGMVIVEAMALGLPVIVTSCDGGPKEIVDEGRFGRLVPPEDPEALAEAVADLIRDPVERQWLGEAALRRAEVYHPHRIAENVLEIEEYVRKKPET